MLNPTRLQSFFEDNKIPLKAEVEIGQKNVNDLLNQSSKFGMAFTTFIATSALDITSNSFKTNYASYDDLYEAYAHFMIGYSDCAKC